MYFQSFFLTLRVLELPPKIFGCVSFIHIPKQSRDKLDLRALRCVFHGYSSNQKGYKCYHTPTRSYITMDVTFSKSQPYFTHTYLQGEIGGTEDKLSGIFPRNGENGGGVLPQLVNVSNVYTSNTSSSPTVQDISAPEFSDSAPTLPIVPNVPALDSSKESTSEHKKFQHTPNEELIVEKLPTEIPANELEIQLREREYMLPENTSKLKVYLRKGKSTTSSHIPSSNPKSSNENTHSSVYNDLYLAHCIEERH